MQFYFPESKSVLQAQMMVDWKRSRSVYNFKTLPHTAIICVDYGVVQHLASFRTQKIKGLKGRNFVKHELLFCSGFDNGGPGILNLLEELRALGVQRFVFIGLAGRMSATVPEASVSAVEKAISGSGCTLYYHDQSVLQPFDAAFYNDLKRKLETEVCTCFSTDAPFRETGPVLEQAIAAGATMIEMECAAIYAFAHFYKVPSLCFLIAADDVSNGWKAPKDWGLLIKAQRKFVDRLIKSLS
jgi:uridine phosphorylase